MLHDFVYSSPVGLVLILLFFICALSLFFGIIISKEFEYHDSLVKWYHKLFGK